MRTGQRMFVAVLPPDDVLDDLQAEAERLRSEIEPDRARRFRWTVREQWHVTLAFLASVPDTTLDDLSARLARAALRRTPFDLAVAGGGAFSSRRRARVLWTGVEDRSGGGLRRLADGVQAACRRAGLEVEEGRRFRPHLTLARLSQPDDVTHLVEDLRGYRGREWRVDSIALVASHLGQGPGRRSRYETAATFRLAAAGEAADESAGDGAGENRIE
ncbi:MAG TPA: RNA 2',3'-cyclic phosphodiesterase [Actinomycetales bacterium]|nr:RNA 2',3'-cyclic phosphodiesterase [Actinomycetales bacterium]